MQKILAFLLLLTFCACALENDSLLGPRKLNLCILSVETGSACLMGNASGVCGGLAGALLERSLSSSHDSDYWAGFGGAVLGYVVCYPIGSALGANISGEALKAGGSFWGAFGGACAGLVADGFVLAYWLDVMHPSALAVSAFALVPSIFSVAGYNIFAGTNQEASASKIFSGVSLRDASLGNTDPTNRVQTPMKISLPIVTINW